MGIGLGLHIQLLKTSKGMNNMSKFLAALFLLSLTFLNQLGNFYYTYGIWPKSWASFTLFWISGMIVYALLDLIRKESE